VQVTTENTRGVALNRGRAFDDDDSDVDLDGLYGCFCLDVDRAAVYARLRCIEGLGERTSA